MEQPFSEESTENQSPVGSENKPCNFLSFKKIFKKAGSDIHNMFKSLNGTLTDEDQSFYRKITQRELKNHRNSEI